MTIRVAICLGIFLLLSDISQAAEYGPSGGVDVTDGSPAELDATALEKLRMNDESRMQSDGTWPTNGAYDETRYLEFHFDPKLPAGTQITSTSITHDFRRTGTLTAAKLEIWNGSQFIDVPQGLPSRTNSDFLETKDITQIAADVSLLNSLKIRFLAYRETAVNTRTSHDQIVLTVVAAGTTEIQPTPTPVATPTPTLIPTPSATPAPTPTPIPTPTPGSTPTPTPTFTPAYTPTSIPTPSPSSTVTPLPAPTPQATATPTPRPTPSTAPTQIATPIPVIATTEPAPVFRPTPHATPLPTSERTPEVRIAQADTQPVPTPRIVRNTPRATPRPPGRATASRALSASVAKAVPARAPRTIRSSRASLVRPWILSGLAGLLLLGLHSGANRGKRG